MLPVSNIGSGLADNAVAKILYGYGLHQQITSMIVSRETVDFAIAGLTLERSVRCGIRYNAPDTDQCVSKILAQHFDLFNHGVVEIGAAADRGENSAYVDQDTPPDQDGVGWVREKMPGCARIGAGVEWVVQMVLAGPGHVKIRTHCWDK
nr:hypothetical protein Iba_chr04bCG13660 [Ipomoea batatas]